VISAYKIVNKSHHFALRDAPAGRISVGFEINRAWKSLAVFRPAATMSDEILGLSCSGALARVGKVIGASDQSDIVRAVILLGEV
jgi:hypothetical protein